MSPRVLLLHYPNVLSPNLMRANADDTRNRSWVQLAKTGSFTSNRYGKFSITTADLTQMVKNFHEVIPKPPTQLVIDFDHLSNDPQRPGDAIAAGWIQALEVRESGTALFGLVEWTPNAAEKIKNREYRFISPSFTNDYTDTHSGKKVGTVLLAAALTNRPFLQGLDSVALCSDAITGHLAMSDTALPLSYQETSMNESLHLSMDGVQVGQKVTFAPNADELAPELTPEERTATYMIQCIRGQGDDAFVVLASLDGKPYGWFPVAALAPAPAPAEVPSPLPEETTEIPDPTALAVPPPSWGAHPPVVPRNFNSGTPAPVTLSTAEEVDAHLLALSTQIAKDEHISLGMAAKKAAQQMTQMQADWADIYRDIEREADPVPVVSLSKEMRSAENFIALVHCVQATHKLVDLRDAIALASQARPDLAERYRTDGL